MAFINTAVVTKSLGPREAAAAQPDPMVQFEAWFSEAQAARLPQPEAMALATATPAGYPSARMVLLRGLDKRGFVFFTNYKSRKGSELMANPRAALVFFWQELDRQVRVEGSVEIVSGEESDVYFRSRPRGSQLGAWASPQSQVIPSRDFLEGQAGAFAERYQGQEVPRPPHWGGLRVVAEMIEFWQGMQDRLHDRLRYRWDGACWLMDRLAP